MTPVGHRPYRAAWEHERVIGYMEEGLGEEFEPELGRAFVQMMAQWHTQIAVLESETEALPVGTPENERATDGGDAPVAGPEDPDSNGAPQNTTSEASGEAPTGESSSDA